MYFSLTLITTVGFGNESANSVPEKVAVSVAMPIFGPLPFLPLSLSAASGDWDRDAALMHAVVFGNVTAIIQRMYARRYAYDVLNMELEEFCKVGSRSRACWVDNGVGEAADLRGAPGPEEENVRRDAGHVDGQPRDQLPQGELTKPPRRVQIALGLDSWWVSCRRRCGRTSTRTSSRTSWHSRYLRARPGAARRPSPSRLLASSWPSLVHVQ